MRFILVGLVFILIGVPFYLEKVKPNRWSGFRTRKTLSSPEVWYAANKVMGFDLILAGGAMLILSLAVVAINRWYSPIPVYKINFIFFLIALAAVAAHCFWVLRRL